MYSTEVQGDQLIVKIDISAKAIAEAPPSSSGKTKLVASSGGAIAIQGTPVKLSFNVMAK